MHTSTFSCFAWFVVLFFDSKYPIHFVPVVACFLFCFHSHTTIASYTNMTPFGQTSCCNATPYHDMPAFCYPSLNTVSPVCFSFVPRHLLYLAQENTTAFYFRTTVCCLGRNKKRFLFFFFVLFVLLALLFLLHQHSLIILPKSEAIHLPFN